MPEKMLPLLGTPHYVLEWSMVLLMTSDRQVSTLLAREIGPDELVFKSFRELPEGTVLPVELQVPGYSLRANGRVDAQWQVSERQWHGVMRIALHPASESLLIDHLARVGRQCWPTSEANVPVSRPVPAPHFAYQF